MTLVPARNGVNARLSHLAGGRVDISVQSLIGARTLTATLAAGRDSVFSRQLLPLQWAASDKPVEVWSLVISASAANKASKREFFFGVSRGIDTTNTTVGAGGASLSIKI